MQQTEIISTPEIKKYFAILSKQVNERFAVAKEARAKGKDVCCEVESPPVADLGERVESIVGPKGVAKRYRELFKELKGNRLNVIFKVFEEIIAQKWCKIEDEEQRVSQAIKTALTIETEGVVVSPIDGVPKICISKNPDGSKYVDVYFAGPIRAAGGRSTVLPLILGDWARKLLNLGKYQPTDDEIERYVEEIGLYQSEVVARQLMLTDEEIRIIAKNCPVCVNGVPTVDREVSVYRDLERIPTNRIRGGMGLVVTEGIGLKAMWVMETAKKLGLDWSWLEQIIKVKKSSDAKIEIKPNFKYLDRMAAGRPILAYPMKYGGFRIRYGRGRNTCAMAKAINPSTMVLLDEFIAVGTHIRLERPGKAAQLFPCDSIDGPIVLLNSGEVKRVNSAEEAEKIKNSVKKILFLGDLLVTLGDFRKLAHPLLPSPYVEDWWKKELEKAMKEKNIKEVDGIDLEKILENYKTIDGETAVKLSEKLNIPLHPFHLHFFTALKKEELIELIAAMRNAKILKEKEKIAGIEIEFDEKIKEFLENIGLPHKLSEEKIFIEEEFAFSIAKIFAIEDKSKLFSGESVLEILSDLSGLKIRDKAGSFVGARMGRPEQAKPREMKGNPHVLFPIGLAGGSTRNINKAMFGSKNHERMGIIKVEAGIWKCPKCNETGIQPTCYKCGSKTVKIGRCPKCGRAGEKKECEHCNTKLIGVEEKEIDLQEIVNHALTGLRVKMPDPVKGVKGLFNQNKIAEPIEKGILRAKHDIHVFRDGTSRFELLNAALTHFKPREINLSIEKVKELGYEKDIEGKEIASAEQIIELFPQDIIVNEKAGEWLVRVSNFIDELLERFYGLKAVYNAKTKEDLIGELIIGLAPHTSAGIVGRILGYSKARVAWQHPYFVMVKRRNCLTGKMPVLINSPKGIKSISIEELDTGNKLEEIPLQNVHTLTIDEKGKLKKEKVLALLKRKSPKKVFEIKTRFGRKIQATKEHKLLVFENKKIVKKEIGSLKENDFLLDLTELKIEKELKEINVLEHYLQKPSEKKKKLRVHGVKKELKEWVEKNGGCWKTAKELNSIYFGKQIHTAIWFDSVPLDLFEALMKKMKKNSAQFKKALIGYNKQKAQIPAEIKLSRDLGEILGYYLADGCYRTTNNGKNKKFVYQINFVSAEKEITKRMVKNIKNELNGKTTRENRNGLQYLTLSGRVFFELFDEIFCIGKNAKTKKVPIQILNSTEECIEGFVAGYVVGDGSIDKNCIKTSSVNQNLTNQMGLLCNRLNCFPHFFEENRAINSGCVKEFYEKKGVKKEIHSFGIKLYSTDLTKVGKNLFGAKKEKIKKLINKMNFRGKRVKRVGKFVLDKITCIKEVPCKSKFVYDLIVEGSKSYVGGYGNLAVFDCDGDQDSVMLLLDTLLNFSESYLSDARGGRMDAPLVFTTRINPTEIENEIYEMETCKEFPLEFFEKTLEYSSPFLEFVPVVANKLDTKEQFTNLNFSFSTATFDQGPKQSMYVQLHSMEDKIRRQAKLQNKIAAVEGKDALERVLLSHFIPDIVGNTRAFARQTFRCTSCNAKYRRIPLSGKCTKCENGNIILTIAEGSVKKYLKIAKDIVREYQLSDYLKQRLELIEKEISSVFENQKSEQKSLYEFV